MDVEIIGSEDSWMQRYEDPRMEIPACVDL